MTSTHNAGETPVTERRQSLASMIRDFQKGAGKPVVGLRLYRDGTVDLLTEAPAASLAANDETDWVDLAGTSQISGPGRA